MQCTCLLLGAHAIHVCFRLPDRRGELESERWGGGAGARKEGHRPLAVREEGSAGAGLFPFLPTPDRYALASLSKHLLAHSRFTLLSLPQLYISW